MKPVVPHRFTCFSAFLSSCLLWSDTYQFSTMLQASGMQVHFAVLLSLQNNSPHKNCNSGSDLYIFKTFFCAILSSKWQGYTRVSATERLSEWVGNPQPWGSAACDQRFSFVNHSSVILARFTEIGCLSYKTVCRVNSCKTSKNVQCWETDGHQLKDSKYFHEKV